jgi:hypothetical protein
MRVRLNVAGVGDMHWRKSAWALIVWTALMIPWLFYSAVATAAGCTEEQPGFCTFYVGFAVVAVLFVWFVVAVPLAIIWHSARLKRQLCPACGRSALVGRMRCRCGYGFVQYPPGS